MGKLNKLAAAFAEKALPESAKVPPFSAKVPLFLPKAPVKTAQAPSKSSKTGNIGYGCGKCGCQEYQLHRTKLWQCADCGSLYPYISALKHIKRDGQLAPWVNPCPLCANPWMMRSLQGFYFCPFCQDFPDDIWQVLVFAGNHGSN